MVNWIFSVSYAPEGRDLRRRAVVGPASISTVEKALQLAGVHEAGQAQIRQEATVRLFIEGALDPDAHGYYVSQPVPGERSWAVCIGSVHEVAASLK